MPSEISAGSNPPVVVDANVWISSVLTDDRVHAVSESWLTRQTLPNSGVILPSLALAEIAGAIGRVANDERLARAVLSRVQSLRSVQIHALDHDLAVAAANLAIDLRLRGPDAVYVALAARFRIPLVTWDREVLDRAGPRIAVLTPSGDH